MQYLIDHKIVPKEFLVIAIEELAETLLVDVLRWDDGTYEFIEGLPDLVDKEFISISTNYLVFKALQQSNEKMRPEEE